MITKLQLKMKNYALDHNFILNPNSKTVKTIVKGLIENEKEFGELYCPCRRVTGNKKKDKRIICPCVYHKKEIRKFGHCTCELFFKK